MTHNYLQNVAHISQDLGDKEVQFSILEKKLK